MWKYEIVVVIGKRAISLSRVYANDNSDVDSNNDNLQNSNDNGWMAYPFLELKNENLQKSLRKDLS